VARHAAAAVKLTESKPTGTKADGTARRGGWKIGVIHR